MSDDGFAIWEGRELHKLQVWVAEDGNIVIENPEGLKQIHFTPKQWQRITEHVKPVAS